MLADESVVRIVTAAVMYVWPPHHSERHIAGDQPIRLITGDVFTVINVKPSSTPAYHPRTKTFGDTVVLLPDGRFGLIGHITLEMLSSVSL
jgi:hypothetical protein